MLPDASKEDLITILDALQHQNFCLCNTVSNLVKNWPAHPITPEAQQKSGTSFVIKNLTTFSGTQLNTSAVQDTKTAGLKTYKKQSPTLRKNQKMSLLSNQAIEFRNAYQIPNCLSGRTRQKNLIVEEFKEFLEADQNMVLMHPQDREATLKELADLIYVCAQYAENMNWDIEQALRRVHRSNMSKLGEDGKPIYREDGKVLKGPNYQPPDLSDLV